MSETPPQNPAILPARTSKRKRSDVDQRRDRKREADRVAQQNFRKKRRAHVVQLERTINILRKGNGSAATYELIEEIQQLRSENDRLRRVIDNAKSALSLSACEASSSEYYSSQVC